MTLTDIVPGVDEQEVAERVARLLDLHPPAETDAGEFLGARFDAGLAWVDFPVALGGLGAPMSLQAVVDDALTRALAPRPEVRNLIGVQMMAPTVLAFGSDAQQARWLRPAFTCDELWCQLFSEPGAGSDLASLSTRAERDGDRWVLNGQKVWTTLAHLAHWAICLVRTDPTVPKHKGLTFFAVDMRAPGVEVRPLRQISGDAEYNEVFLTDVVVPDDCRIGDPGHGWMAAMTTLTSERGAVGSMATGPAMDGLLRRLLDAWRGADPSRRTPARRDRVVRLWADAQVVRWTAGRDLPPSLTKSAYGELAQALTSTCLDLAGPAGGLVDHYEQSQPTTFTHLGGEADDDLHPTKSFLVSQSLTIAGGTTLVNKNVLGERVLGLPPEPRSPT